MKTIKQAVRALLLFMLILCNIGAYAQKKNGIQHRLAPEGVKLAGMYNIRQSDDNKRTSDEFTFVGCFPADNPKYTIGMVVIRPHKLPANIGMLSKEGNQLIEWVMNRNK